MSTPAPYLSWLGIARLGLVQMGLGAVVVIATSTLNRVMVIELGLPAIVPGALVAVHYLLQVLRPRLGHGSDQGARRVPFILGGMAALALGGTGAAFATGWMLTAPLAGGALALASFILIGLGVGAAGTALLTLLATRTAPDRRASAAAIVWLMMIAGIALTAGIASKLLDPFSPARLLAVVGSVCVIAFLLACLAVRGAEPAPTAAQTAAPGAAPAPFLATMAAIWAEPASRRFAIFVFLSMLAYSAQELLLEPFAGSVLGYTPGQSAGFAGAMHGGVLLGMASVAILARHVGGLRFWTGFGCLGSAICILLLAASGMVPAIPRTATVIALGAANGCFAVSAIGAMMGLASAGGGHEGARMGVFGAAQALAFGLGGLLGPAASDIARQLIGHPASGYAVVFTLEAALFAAAGLLARRIFTDAARSPRPITRAQKVLANAVSS